MSSELIIIGRNINLLPFELLLLPPSRPFFDWSNKLVIINEEPKRECDWILNYSTTNFPQYYPLLRPMQGAWGEEGSTWVSIFFKLQHSVNCHNHPQPLLLVQYCHDALSYASVQRQQSSVALHFKNLKKLTHLHILLVS